MEHREPFERRLLVGGIVIDVGVRIPTQTIDHEIRRLLEGRLFLVPIVCPERVKSLLAVVDRDDPEQILQPAVKQRVSLHVEKHVALAWARQPRQAAARFGIQQFDHPFARLALVGLKTRSEEHTTELQSLMSSSYAVFCLKKKKQHAQIKTTSAKTNIL